MLNFGWQSKHACPTSCIRSSIMQRVSSTLQACQILRLGTLWGSNSIILPAVVTDWTGSGWLCRVYLSAALGFFQPFCSIFTLVMLAAAVRYGRVCARGLNKSIANQLHLTLLVLFRRPPSGLEQYSMYYMVGG